MAMDFIGFVDKMSSLAFSRHVMALHLGAGKQFWRQIARATEQTSRCIPTKAIRSLASRPLAGPAARLSVHWPM